MKSSLNLANIAANKFYEIEGFDEGPISYAEKLYKMGFIKGTPVQLAPVKMSDPMIIQIRGSRIALRKKEAELILVKEITHA